MDQALRETDGESQTGRDRETETDREMEIERQTETDRQMDGEGTQGLRMPSGMLSS